MSISALDYLRHIRDEAAFLNEATKSVPIATFLDDSVLKRACVRAIEVIGEAAKKVPDDFRARHPEVEWRRWRACGIALFMIISAWIIILFPCRHGEVRNSGGGNVRHHRT